jgi:four helix bundle protein
MNAKSYRELICWQLSVQLRDELIEITARPAFARNFKLCEQVGDSTRSPPSNISEGFGRSDAEFRHYLEIALGSLKETENHLDEALARKYVTTTEHQHLRRLAKRAYLAAIRLCEYLGRCIEQKRRRRPKRRGPPRSDPIGPDPT